MNIIIIIIIIVLASRFSCCRGLNGFSHGSSCRCVWGYNFPPQGTRARSGCSPGSCRSVWMLSDQLFFGHPLGQLPTMLRSRILPDHLSSSMHLRWPNYLILLHLHTSGSVCRPSNLWSTVIGLLAASLTEHIHLTMLFSFLTCQLVPSMVRGQVSLP